MLQALVLIQIGTTKAKGIKEMILIQGRPRSGTTWLGKIFDSHPNVVYRHEPDSLVVNADIPFTPYAEDCANYETAARQYLQKIKHVRQTKYWCENVGEQIFLVAHVGREKSDKLWNRKNIYVFFRCFCIVSYRCYF